MAEYIDRDKMLERLKFKRDTDNIDKKKYAGLECAIAQCLKAPTEDVVPRNEVEAMQKKYEGEISKLEREIEDLESTQEIAPEAKYFVDTKADKMISLLTEINKTQDQVKQEVAREIFEEIEVETELYDRYEPISTLIDFLAELKKKYIGEQ